IVDPQFGVRLTGTLGRWSLGLLAADDRAPGKLLPEGDLMGGNRAGIGVFRLEREFGHQSQIGVFASDREFGGSSNRVASFDARIGLGGNWYATGQAISSESRLPGGQRLAGPAWKSSLSRDGRHFYYSTTYTDRSPGFRAELGFIPRVDIRELKHRAYYRWRPEGRSVVSFGPGATVITNWDHQGRLQDWSTASDFLLELPRLTQIQATQTRSFELFDGLRFRKRESGIAFSTECYKWLALNGEFTRGTGINYYPGNALPAFLANATSGSLGLTLRPRPRLRFDESYLYSRLGARREWLPPGAGATNGAIFNNHIVRSKVNYQFSRALSLRAIFDYNGVLPNASLVSLDPGRRAGADVLLTYFLHPGTALYMGYSNALENVIFDPMQSPALRRTQFPDTSTGSQVFVKLSYLFRF
ncbi:MAG: hypothetical protein M1436_02965, partial [Acidobacteria bacterium]|nr:hypothetical protein [Acidobacteriota bacterium]